MPASTGRRSLPTFTLYRNILALPGARAFFLAGIPGRIGIAMTGLGLVFLLHWGTGSFAVGGQVVAAFAVAEAVAGPQLSRLMDRHGQPRVLPPALLAHSVAVGALVAIVVAGGPSWAMITLGALIGATLP